MRVVEMAWPFQGGTMKREGKWIYRVWLQRACFSLWDDKWRRLDDTWIDGASVKGHVHSTGVNVDLVLLQDSEAVRCRRPGVEGRLVGEGWVPFPLLQQLRAAAGHVQGRGSIACAHCFPEECTGFQALLNHIIQ